MDLYVIVAVGLLAALVFAASFLRIKLPTPVGDTALHLGNVLCLLAGLLLGGLNGGLAAGFGSFFFDLVYPGYAESAPYTLVFKFLLAFVCGVIAYAGGRKGQKTSTNIIGAIAGSLTYVVLYLGKSFLFDVWFARTEVATAVTDVAAKAVVSTTNAVIAVVVAVPLAIAVRRAVKGTAIYKRITR
ncbi:MAG: ECF transporter S component [Acetanaerobacterium sp.]